MGKPLIDTLPEVVNKFLSYPLKAFSPTLGSMASGGGFATGFMVEMSPARTPRLRGVRRTHNRCTCAFAASASVGAFGVYLLLAASISLVALAGAGRVWKCCGINCGISWTAHSIRNSGTIAVGLPAHPTGRG